MTDLRHWDDTLPSNAPQSSGDVEDVEEMASKLAARDASGDTAFRRVKLAHHVEVGTAATGKARFQATAPTAAGHLQVDPSTGIAFVYVNGASRAVPVGIKAEYLKAEADGADGDQILAPLPISDAIGFPWTITDAYFIPSAALMADVNNYVTLTVAAYDISNGDFAYDLAIASTSSAADWPTGDWTAGAKVQMALQSGSLLGPLDAGYYVGFTMTKINAGVSVPAGRLVVTCAPWQ